MDRKENIFKWRAICQGCPIIPYLYFFMANVLGYMIFDPRYKIEGLTFPHVPKFETKCLQMT